MVNYHMSVSYTHLTLPTKARRRVDLCGRRIVKKKKKKKQEKTKKEKEKKEKKRKKKKKAKKKK